MNDTYLYTYIYIYIYIYIYNLTAILNLAVNLNITPQIWKLAKIVPIPKPNKDPGIGTSYRPISLLSPIAKTLEKVLLPHITQNIPQTTHQHGFKAFHPQPLPFKIG